ncbi:hypothetical protein LOAG_03633 [Loa loa]|uniref:Uncharacterized protein n=1 Tax=Loa loa TaxID=7209 RepID=A0A1S0U499_LOALO|nr:hypothetical protein LOAG_03633 [Loa loa]EFO24854.1 hypothetical protein LOAG_03633 [Loa loa]
MREKKQLTADNGSNSIVRFVIDRNISSVSDLLNATVLLNKLPVENGIPVSLRETLILAVNNGILATEISFSSLHAKIARLLARHYQTINRRQCKATRYCQEVGEYYWRN